MIDAALVLVALFALRSALVRIAKSYRTPWRAFYFLLPLLILLVPGVGSAPTLRIEEALLFLLAPFIVLRKPIHRLAKVELLFLVWCLMIPLSILMGYLLDGIIFFRDFNEYFRIIKYWLIVRLAISLPWSEKQVTDGVWIFLWTGLIGACIAFAQARDSFAINRLFTPLFIGEHHLRGARLRVPGTIGNSNNFGVFLAMAASVALSTLLFGRLSHKQKTTVSIILIASVGALVQTFSKGSFVALMISFVLSLWTFGLKQRGAYRVIYALILLIGLTMIVIVSNKAYIEAASFGSAGEVYVEGSAVQVLVYRFWDKQAMSPSVKGRLVNWQLALDVASSALLFGSGPSKYEIEDINYHSQYLWLLRQYGVFGLTVYLLLLWAGAGTAIRLFKHRKTPQGQFAIVLAGSTLSVVCIFALTSFIYHVFQNLQLASIFFWFVGMTLAYGNSVQGSLKSG